MRWLSRYGEENSRQNAKDLVADLYSATSKAGCDVPRIATYQDAMASFNDLKPSVHCR